MRKEKYTLSIDVTLEKLGNSAMDTGGFKGKNIEKILAIMEEGLKDFQKNYNLR